MQREHWRRALVVAALAGIIVGCGDGPASFAQEAGSRGGRAARGGSVIVLAAASTTEALTAVAERFERRTGIDVRISPAASNALAAQILAGAPGDLFISASRAWSDAVREAGRALDVRPLLSNDLVLIVPRGNPAGVRSPADLAAGRVQKVALAGERVPAGIYAEQALRSLGLYGRLASGNRIARGQDVRGTLSYVERGEAEAGIVYATDAKISDLVETVYTFSPDRYDEIAYPVVLLKAADTNPAARRFYEYLFTEAAGEIFRRYGFTLPWHRRPAGGPGEGTLSAGGTPAPRQEVTDGEGGWLLSPGEWRAVRLSLLVAAVAVAASLPLGIGLGWLLARRRFRGKSAVETLVNLPLVLPPVVTGYLLLVAFGRQGWIGYHLEQWFGLRLVFDWKGAALASAVVAFPLMVRAVRLAFTTVDVRLEQAARTLGAGPLDTFFSVTLPLARHGIIAGSVLAFARSMGEFGATIMIAGNIPGQTRTIPLYIYNVLEAPGGLEQSRSIVLVSIGIAAAALAVGEYLERRGRARLEA